MIIGCVDNAAARNEIRTALGPKPWDPDDQPAPTWWLDCGNDESSGQVILSLVGDRRGLLGSFASSKICKALPAPSLVAPDLLVARPEETIAQSNISCAEIQLANDQSLADNQMVASIATDYLLRFCFGGLKRLGTFFDLEAGSARSRYITPEEISSVVQ